MGSSDVKGGLQCPETSFSKRTERRLQVWWVWNQFKSWGITLMESAFNLTTWQNPGLSEPSPIDRYVYTWTQKTLCPSNPQHTTQMLLSEAGSSWLKAERRPSKVRLQNILRTHWPLLWTESFYKLWKHLQAKRRSLPADHPFMELPMKHTSLFHAQWVIWCIFISSFFLTNKFSFISCE